MEKQATTLTENVKINEATLLQLKIAIIDKTWVDNPKYKEILAEQQCFSSYNLLQYKRKQLADRVAAFEIAMEEGRTIRAESEERICTAIYQEIQCIEERHIADCFVYNGFSGGKDWTPPQQRNKAQPSHEMKSRIDEFKKVLAA